MSKEAINAALDKKAENARELGLNYEPPQQEPVAKHYANGGHLIYPKAQRPWVGLTEPERLACYDLNPARFASAIEAALRSKNT